MVCTPRKTKSRFLSAMLVLFPLAVLCGETGFPVEPLPPPGFPETARVRRIAETRWLQDAWSAVAARTPETVTDEFGFRAEFSCAVDSGTSRLTVFVRPENAHGIQGEWRLIRSPDAGRNEEIRIFPVDDENIFLSLTPDPSDSGKSLLAVSVYGLFLREGIPLGVPFTALLTMPLTEIIRMTQDTAPWALFRPDPAGSRDSRLIARAIRENLSVLFYADDGALDENGRPVHIEDLSPQDTPPEGTVGGVNCSGFVKWIIDGIIRPAAGNGLFIGPLKTSTSNPGSHFTEPHRETRDLFFGLDWCRNLAAAVVSLQRGETILPAESGTDVTVSPFSGGNGYYEDAGYPVAELLPLLYTLAVQEPGCFYLGALNRLRGDPPLRQYHHVAALFPYFTAGGRFAVAVFESAVETGAGTFLARNRDAFIHLSRVPLPEAERFFPQTAPAAPQEP